MNVTIFIIMYNVFSIKGEPVNAYNTYPNVTLYGKIAGLIIAKIVFWSFMGFYRRYFESLYKIACGKG